MLSKNLVVKGQTTKYRRQPLQEIERWKTTDWHSRGRSSIGKRERYSTRSGRTARGSYRGHAIIDRLIGWPKNSIASIGSNKQKRTDGFVLVNSNYELQHDYLLSC